MTSNCESEHLNNERGGMNRTVGYVVLICWLGMICFCWAGNTDDRDAKDYVGIKSCRMCHKKAAKGNQYAKWQEGPHSKTYEVLATADARATAKKLGIDDPQKSGKCLKCHSTAYNWTESVQTTKIAVADGVTCQSCHGPGKKYKSKKVMVNRKLCIEKGMVYPAKKSCAKCHNDTAPSWKSDRYTTKDGKPTGFDIDKAYEKIKHPNPSAK